MVGLGRSKLLIPNYKLGIREVEIIFNFGGHSAEQVECMEWVAKGLIKPNVHVAISILYHNILKIWLMVN